jgi:hypothetical protein
MFAASFRFGTMFQQLPRTGGTLLSFLLSLVTESLLALGDFFLPKFSPSPDSGCDSRHVVIGFMYCGTPNSVT